MSRRIGMVLALVLAAACGGDDPKPNNPDAGPIDPDAPPGGSTFSGYVIDLIQNQTADNTAPRPFSEVSALEDRDADNQAAFTVLFQ